jgi:hypothetical protein
VALCPGRIILTPPSLGQGTVTMEVTSHGPASQGHFSTIPPSEISQSNSDGGAGDQAEAKARTPGGRRTLIDSVDSDSPDYPFPPTVNPSRLPGNPCYEGVPVFWIDRYHPHSVKQHTAFAAKSRGEVEAFHAAALKAGGTENGAPGLRRPNYYAAFVLDPDSNNMEAVFRGD